MKKLFTIVSILTVGFLLQSSSLIAQATIAPQSNTAVAQLDEKTQKKVDKAKLDLAKDKKDLAKAEENYQKGMEKYAKKKKQGKLSPDDEVKEEKAKQKAEKNIAKLKQSISKGESFLAQYKM